MGYIYCNLLSFLDFFGRSFSSAFSGWVPREIWTQLRWHFQAPCQPNIHATKSWFSWFGFSGSVNTCNDFSLSINLFSFRFLTGATACCTMIIPCITYDNCGGCRTTQCLPTFFKPCFHWVATRELRLITLWKRSNFRYVLLLWRSFLCRSSLVSLLSR